MSEQEWINIFGDNLVDIIKDSRMTQKEFADWIGVSEGTISGYIHKRRMPSITVIIRMAYVLGVSVDELVDFGDNIIR